MEAYHGASDIIRMNMKKQRKALFTSHTANFQKFNRPFMRMLSGTLEKPLDKYNIGEWSVDYASANEEQIFDADNVFLVDFPRNPFLLFQLLKSYHQVKHILDENHYDLIHTHTPVGSVITRLAARKARKNGTKLIYTAHGFHFYKGAPLKNWLLWYPIEKRLSKMCDCLVTINDEDYTLAKKKFRTTVRMINGVGIDTVKFGRALNAKEKDSLRKELNLSPSDFVIVYNGEFNPDKNHEMLIRGVEPLLKKHEDMKLLLISKGALMEPMKKLVSELGIAKQVSFLGYRNDVNQILQICNLYVSPSKREGLVVSVLEAIYCKLPVLLFDNRGHRQILGMHKNSIFKTELEMRKKIEKQYLGIKDYSAPFDEKFSLDSALRSMRKIYLEVME